MFHHLIELCFPGLLGFIFLTSFIAVDRTFPPKTLQITMLTLATGFLLLITDSINYYFQSIGTHTLLRLFMLAISFSAKICCSGFCVALSQRGKGKARIVIYVMMVINGIISFTSIKTGSIFYIRPDFTVGHGFLYFIPYLCIFIICVVLLIEGIHQFRTNPGETIIIVAMIIFPSIATLMEVKFKLHLMEPLAFITCVIFYFMCLNVHLYRRDTLTYLLNRRSFYIDGKKHSRKQMIILSMDLNYLKYYNDKFGHKAGDEALVTTSRFMQKAFSKIGVVYRTGGDEFMTLFVKKTTLEVENCIVDFNKLLSTSEYQVAAGYAVYKPGNDFETIVSEADEKMYANKLEIKKLPGNEKFEMR